MKKQNSTAQVTNAQAKAQAHTHTACGLDRLHADNSAAVRAWSHTVTACKQ